MSSLLIKSESRFPIERKRIKKLVNKTLTELGQCLEAEVSLIFLGCRRMKALNRKYRHLNKVTSVLSFSQLEKKAAGPFFAFPPDNLVRLGDVVICYPEAQRLASQEGISVDKIIDRLVKHGVLNLLKK